MISDCMIKIMLMLTNVKYNVNKSMF